MSLLLVLVFLHSSRALAAETVARYRHHRGGINIHRVFVLHPDQAEVERELLNEGRGALRQPFFEVTMEANAPPCEFCGTPADHGLCIVANRQVVSERCLCKSHFWNAEPHDDESQDELEGAIAKYDLARFHHDFVDKRYFFRLDPVDERGTKLNVETGFVELTCLYHSLDRTARTTHTLLLEVARDLGFRFHQLVIGDFFQETGDFKAQMTLIGNPTGIRFNGSTQRQVQSVGRT